MRRREFLGVLGGTLVASSRTAFAQRPDGTRLVGALFSQVEGDSEGQARVAAFQQGLQELGWTPGQNVRVEYRWGGGGIERMHPPAAELVSLKPDVIFASATTALTALQRATPTIPIVFAQVTDPVGAGFVASLARPGGNITGITQHEFAIGAKWLELLKQLAPAVRRVAILYDPGNPATAGYLREIASAAPAFTVQVSPLAVRDESDVTRALNAFAGEPDGSLILLPGPVGANNRDAIIALAMHHRLPAVYAFRYHVLSGGLASYGVDNIDLFRRAAWYVDRILKGEKPGDLPVQHATKFQLVINLKTAKALSLDPPISLLARTDEVIE